MNIDKKRLNQIAKRSKEVSPNTPTHELTLIMIEIASYVASAYEPEHREDLQQAALVKMLVDYKNIKDIDQTKSYFSRLIACAKSGCQNEWRSRERAKRHGYQIVSFPDDDRYI